MVTGDSSKGGDGSRQWKRNSVVIMAIAVMVMAISDNGDSCHGNGYK